MKRGKQYMATHLCRERFRLEKGVWVRRFQFHDLQVDNVFLLPDGMKVKGREVREVGCTTGLPDAAPDTMDGK